ncbi:MAG: GH3 auxin-responsive promoter family protein [Chthoniobacterales bacterium]
MKVPSAIASGAWLASSIPSWSRFRRALSRPAETQDRILHRLLGRNAESAYGRKFDFKTIRSYEQFNERVPIVDYDDLEPWVERITCGESSVLTTEPVTHLIPTSGSTGGRKLIPFTPSFQRELNAAIGPWMIDLCRQHPTIASGAAYWSISPALPPAGDEKSAVPIGFEDDSNYLGGIRRRLVESAFAVPSILRLAPDIESFRYLTLLCLLRRPDLVLISIWHPSFLALLLDALPAWWEELLGDVNTGKCPRASALPAEIRRAMTVRPGPARAKELAAEDPRRPARLWSRLKLVSCWGDGQAAMAAADLRMRLPQTAVQPKGLLATEAFVSIPFQGQHPLSVASHFFEFCDEDGVIHRAHELHRGQSYSVVVTTGAGLWRYRLGDEIEVDGFVEETPSLRFIGRDGVVSDICGEKLAETFIAQAIAKACAAQSCTPRFAMLAPERDEAGRWGYTLFVEGELSAELPDLLDRELRENPNYTVCRNLGQLRPARCFKVTSGGYAEFVNVSIEEGGQRLGDIKPKVLSNDTRWAKRFEGDYW